LSTLPSSVAFGFYLDLSDWKAESSVLHEWINSLRSCEADPQAIVVAVLIINGYSKQREELLNVHDTLSVYYKGNEDVLVLPMLTPVTRHDVRKWREDLIEFAGARLDEVELETLVHDLFPDDVIEQPIAEIWDAVRRRVHSAWRP
jgi:hypothetical protein